MKPPLWLPLTEAKCIASACKQPRQCARRDITLVKGRPLADYSQPSSYMAECGPSNGWGRFIAHEKAVPPDAKPVVRDWIGK